MPLVVSWTVTSRGRPSSAPSTVSCVHGQLVADLRPLVQGPAQRDRGSEEVVGFLTQRGRVDGHAAMVGTGRGCRSRARVTSWSTSSTSTTGSSPPCPAAGCAPSGCATEPCSSSSTSSAGQLLVHRRSDAKDLWPGRWDVGVGGVVGAGEAWADAAAPRARRGGRRRRRAGAAARRHATPTPTSTSSGAATGSSTTGRSRSPTARWPRPGGSTRAGLDALLATRAVRPRQPRPAAAGRAFPFRPALNTHAG